VKTNQTGNLRLCTVLLLVVSLPSLLGNGVLAQSASDLPPSTGTDSRLEDVSTARVRTDRRTRSRTRIDSRRVRQRSDPGYSLGYVDVSDAEAVRELLLKFAFTIETAVGMEPKATRMLQETSAEGIAKWLSYVPDPEAFITSVQEAVARSDEAGWTFDPQPRLEAAEFLSAMHLDPVYPPSSGPYYVSVVLPLQGFFLVGDNEDRCNADVWGGFHIAFQAARVAAELADGSATLAARGQLIADSVCNIAGCDPIGLACLGFCVAATAANLTLQDAVDVLALAEPLLEIARIPIDLCEIQDGNVDGSEIEAAFKNTKTISMDLDVHAMDLDAHDEDIKALLANMLAAIEENTARLKSVQAVQKQILKLQLTPAGRRAVNETDVLTCLGDACPNVLDCPGRECDFPIR